MPQRMTPFTDLVNRHGSFPLANIHLKMTNAPAFLERVRESIATKASRPPRWRELRLLEKVWLAAALADLSRVTKGLAPVHATAIDRITHSVEFDRSARSAYTEKAGQLGNAPGAARTLDAVFGGGVRSDELWLRTTHGLDGSGATGRSLQQFTDACTRNEVPEPLTAAMLGFAVIQHAKPSLDPAIERADGLHEHPKPEIMRETIWEHLLLPPKVDLAYDFYAVVRLRESVLNAVYATKGVPPVHAQQALDTLRSITFMQTGSSAGINDTQVDEIRDPLLAAVSKAAKDGSWSDAVDLLRETAKRHPAWFTDVSFAQLGVSPPVEPTTRDKGSRARRPPAANDEDLRMAATRLTMATNGTTVLGHYREAKATLIGWGGRLVRTNTGELWRIEPQHLDGKILRVRIRTLDPANSASPVRAPYAKERSSGHESALENAATFKEFLEFKEARPVGFLNADDVVVGKPLPGPIQRSLGTMMRASRDGISPSPEIG
jgi:hypothetical protein